MSDVGRLADAPIWWGVCEVPGWGYQMSPARVLAEMREVGLSATEPGPEGLRPSEPDAMHPHEEPRDEGPVRDVRASADHLRSLLTAAT